MCHDAAGEHRGTARSVTSLIWDPLGPLPLGRFPTIFTTISSSLSARRAPFEYGAFGITLETNQSALAPSAHQTTAHARGTFWVA